MGSRDRGGVVEKAAKVTPNSGGELASCIPANAKTVDVQTVTNGVTDFIVLPALDKVPVGHQIRVCNNANSAFEVRTPATSGEKIQTEDCDGTVEYLATDAEVMIFTKVSDTDGWQGTDLVAAGGVSAATNPD